MSDLIDREAVREFIKSYRHSTDVAFDMEKRLDEIPTASPWRRVEEPPEENGAYVVWWNYKGSSYWFRGVFYDGRWLFEPGTPKPDYWMPIETPKEVQDANN